MALAAAHERHQALAAEAACLHGIEAVDRPTSEAGSAVRVAAWNAERLKHVEAAAELLRVVEADVILLTEVDCGMARSGNRHTVADLAVQLSMSFRFAVEFVELGLGDPAERAAHAGAINDGGLHGAAILSRVPLSADRLVRLGDDGAWFDGSRKGERRVGGRIGLAADVALAGGPLTLCAIHLESHSDAAHRANQMRTLLGSLGRASPAVVAGDLNTKKAGSGAVMDEAAPSDEPLFAAARQAGFGWQSANAPGPTQRLRPHEPPVPLLRLDWMLVRDVAASRPLTIPAVGRDGTVLADHDVLVADLELR